MRLPTEKEGCLLYAVTLTPPRARTWPLWLTLSVCPFQLWKCKSGCGAARRRTNEQIMAAPLARSLLRLRAYVHFCDFCHMQACTFVVVYIGPSSQTMSFTTATAKCIVSAATAAANVERDLSPFSSMLFFLQFYRISLFVPLKAAPSLPIVHSYFE